MAYRLRGDLELFPMPDGSAIAVEGAHGVAHALSPPAAAILQASPAWSVEELANWLAGIGVTGHVEQVADACLRELSAAGLLIADGREAIDG